jgi:hypothetical protein
MDAISMDCDMLMALACALAGSLSPELVALFMAIIIAPWAWPCTGDTTRGGVGVEGMFPFPNRREQ